MPRVKLASNVADLGAARLAEAGLATFDELDTTCCCALQDEVWVRDPAGASA